MSSSDSNSGEVKVKTEVLLPNSTPQVSMCGPWAGGGRWESMARDLCADLFHCCQIDIKILISLIMIRDSLLFETVETNRLYCRRFSKINRPINPSFILFKNNPTVSPF